jgi:uncharacterized membrane protein
MTKRGAAFPLMPGAVIGVAVAGFFDGVVLHQILQWHHMICVEAHCAFVTVDSLKQATFRDGLFHAVMWLTLLCGLYLASSALRSGLPFVESRFWGSLMLGAGVFNVVEGVVDHHILQIHHVRFGPTQTIMDVGFLIVSALLALAGWRLSQRPSPSHPVSS